MLRELRDDDLESTMSVVGDPEVVRHLSFDVRTPDEQSAVLKHIMAGAQRVPREDYYLAIVSRADDGFVGLGRIRIVYARGGQIGYAIRRDRWGEGLGREAVIGILGFAFETLGLHRVEATYRPANTRSASVLTKLGFQQEGLLREHVYAAGAWHDSLISSILEHEWRSRL